MIKKQLSSIMTMSIMNHIIFVATEANAKGRMQDPLQQHLQGVQKKNNETGCGPTKLYKQQKVNLSTTKMLIKSRIRLSLSLSFKL
jgi:hypothetical protein